MKNYDKLRKKVYEIIYPDGIPLEVGCMVMIYTNGEEIQATESNSYSETNWSDIVMLYNNNYLEHCSSEFDLSDVRKGEYDDRYGEVIYFENLGPNLTLQSIFLALGKKDISYVEIWEGEKMVLCHKDHKSTRPSTIIDLNKQPKERREDKLLAILNLLDERR